MSAQRVCEVMEASIRALIPDAQVLSVPVADGGEGTVDCFVTAVGAEKVVCPAVHPRGTPMESFYGRLGDGTAVVEMAAAAGLPLMEGQLDPMGATTYGVGLLIADAVRRGARRVILGLGGSAATTDFYQGKLGMAGADSGGHGVLWAGRQKLNVHHKKPRYAPHAPYAAMGSAALRLVAEGEGPCQDRPLHSRDPDGNLIEIILSQQKGHAHKRL